MKAIVVVDEHWGIGKKGNLLFHLTKDMAFFRQKTLGKTVVMGANTFRSLPHGALPKRTNVVLDDAERDYANAVVVHSVEELLRAVDVNSDDVFVIGGASVYRLLLDMCDEAFVTKVFADGEAEVFFPNLDERADWQLVEQSAVTEDNGYSICFCRYRKRAN